MPPSPRGSRAPRVDASTEASGPHAFVVRDSTVRQRRLRIHRNPPLVRDDGQRPSSRDGMAATMPLITTSVKAKYFFGRGLDIYFRKSEGDLPDGSPCRGDAGVLARSARTDIVSAMTADVAQGPRQSTHPRCPPTGVSRTCAADGARSEMGQEQSSRPARQTET